jgi:hypothetical protein
VGVRQEVCQVAVLRPEVLQAAGGRGQACSALGHVVGVRCVVYQAAGGGGQACVASGHVVGGRWGRWGWAPGPGGSIAMDDLATAHKESWWPCCKGSHRAVP